MKIKVLLETYIDTKHFSVPDILNADTLNDYKEELNAEMLNDSLEEIWQCPMRELSEDCKIISVEPYEEGIDEYNKYCDNWENNYQKELNKFIENYGNK
jgi:hypothetical protein